MRATKAPSKMEIGRRPDRRTEVSELAHIDIVNNLATGKKPPPRAFFGAIYRNITLLLVNSAAQEEGPSLLL